MKNEYAPNSTGERHEAYESGGADVKRIQAQAMPNTRAHGYITNEFAGGNVHSTKAKVKGKSEHIKQEDEYGDDYGV